MALLRGFPFLILEASSLLLHTILRTLLSRTNASVALLVCLLVTNVQAQSSTPPLERIITISFYQDPVDGALKKIAQQASITFSYSASAFDTKRTITKNYINKTLREVLMDLLEGKVLIKQKGNYIILTKAETSDVVVSGYVVDESTGEKLKEVTVYDPISLKSAVTDEFGFFELEVDKPSEEDIQLVINRSMYADTMVMVSAKRSSFQNISLSIDKEKWEVMTDSLESKIDRLWLWTKQSVQRANMKNVRDTLHRVWQVSFVPFIGTNHYLSGNVVNDYSLNILGGYSAGTNKVELGGLFNINRGSVRHVQAAGLFNLNGGRTEGVQLAGLFNTNFDSSRVAQFAGLVNFNESFSEGVQAAGLSNLTIGHYRGPQVAGLFNFVSGNIRGTQVAGLFNVAPKKVEGAQVAGFFNVGEEITGSQVASFVNVAGSVRGTQVALLNIADSVRGVPVGLLSFVKSGYHKLELSADEVLPVNVGFRTGVRQFYNIITAGVRPEESDTVTWSFGYGIGVAPKITKWWFLNMDITSNQLVKGNMEALNMINKLYLGFDFQLTKRFSITAGGTLNFRIYEAGFENHPELFTNYSPNIINQGVFDGNNNYQLWWGAKVGLRFF